MSKITGGVFLSLDIFVMAASLMASLAASMVVTQATDGDMEAVQAIEGMGGRVERATARAGMPVVRVELNGKASQSTSSSQPPSPRRPRRS